MGQIIGPGDPPPPHQMQRQIQQTRTNSNLEESIGYSSVNIDTQQNKVNDVEGE